MSADVINLTLCNESNDPNHNDILIFQKNIAPGFSEIAVAWRVIQNLGQGDHHAFKFPFELMVNTNDSYGNHTPSLVATPGERYAHAMVRNTGRKVFEKQPGHAASRTDIDVDNKLEIGAIGANIYREGRLLAKKTSIAPAQKAVFEFTPTICIGVASQVQEGQVINSAVLSSINTELSLLCISSADIVMMGGGPGAGSVAFEFHFANVKKQFPASPNAQ